LNPKWTKWFNKTFREKLVFILILVIVSLISILTSTILGLDFKTKIVYFLGALLGLIILLLFLYIIDFIQKLDELRLDECIAQDITILNLEKNLIFNEHSRDNGALNEEIRIIRNNMPHNYNLYQFKNSVAVEPPPFAQFTFEKDGKRMNYSDTDVQFKPYDQVDYEDNLNKKIDFKFPVHAPPHETRDIKVKYPIKAFDAAINGDPDWVQITINAVTERARISVQLEGTLRGTHIVAPPLPPNSRGEEQDIEIRDFSDERMWNSELMYKHENIKPKWGNHYMEWVIYRPKIGYKYRVHFTIKPKNE
jgi:hypothetical protein